MLSRELVRDNPWWADPAAIEADPHLRRLARRSLVFRHPLTFDMDQDAAYTLRGPRQVGKTTLLKRIVRELLRERAVPPRQVLFLDAGAVGIRNVRDLQQTLTSYLTDARSASPAGRCYLLIDEVTGVEDWGTCLRTLHGRGLLEGTTFLATGSHALDVRRGGERAPGRRGAVAHWDWVMMPLSFRDYVEVHDPGLARGLPQFASLARADVMDCAREIWLHADRLSAYFERYLLTGGFPHAAEAEATERRIPAHEYRLQQDAVKGEVARAGLRETYFRELVSWLVGRGPGSELSWRDASADTDIGSKDTARRYIEDAEGLFVWHVFYRLKDPDKAEVALRSPKKIYPADPFQWHALSAGATGEQDPWESALRTVAEKRMRGHLVESVVADHLRRAIGPFAYYYRSRSGALEVDFVLMTGAGRRHLVEVKTRDRIQPRDLKTLRRLGGGVLVSKDTLELHADEGVAVVPAAAYLAGLPGCLTLFPARD